MEEFVFAFIVFFICVFVCIGGFGSRISSASVLPRQGSI